MPALGVNIDHVATIRQARRTIEPDPVWAAALAELGGADGITIHLREDRRHIIDRDVRLLKETVQVKLNLEMAAEEEILGIALETLPDQCTLVPEKREEITTEGGLDVLGQSERVRTACRRLQEAGMEVSLFIDPVAEQITAAAELGADAVELHTGAYADAVSTCIVQMGENFKKRGQGEFKGSFLVRGLGQKSFSCSLQGKIISCSGG